MGQNFQFSAVLLGSSLQFSNNLIRVLAFEFPEVRFDRHLDTASLRKISPRPRLVVVHEAVPDVEQSIRDARAHLPDAMVAMACADTSRFRDALSPEISRSVSILPLNTPIDVWLSILRLLLCGHSYAPTEEVGAVRDGVQRPSESPAEDRNDAEVCLTPREMEILPLIAQGFQNKVIAGTRTLSEHTVKLHTHNIFAKIGVSNRTAAAQWYMSKVEGAERLKAIHDR